MPDLVGARPAVFSVDWEADKRKGSVGRDGGFSFPKPQTQQHGNTHFHHHPSPYRMGGLQLLGLCFLVVLYPPPQAEQNYDDWPDMVTHVVDVCTYHANMLHTC